MKVVDYCRGKEEEKYLVEHPGSVYPCPICGRTPVPMIHVDFGSFFATVSCFGGSLGSHAYVKVQAEEPDKALQKATERWNDGSIDYFERLPNVFRSCYTCSNYTRDKGKTVGKCRNGIKVSNARNGCKENYDRIAKEDFRKILTR